ncbi:hypothetical protein OQX61_07505 [Pedobacter sp. PLR]|uniref:hypothetical protein n=1 Tax=Pedobacter sp. PLR TaxID=2994465 RepID=UPI00224639AC|nr:hypothetical protein [Pedobacter sp. PLR]MCX2451115.1 hypothetical protein [Pedobacter sp. PLR]
MDILAQQALYEANKVTGRGKFCPRIGTYRIIDIFKSTCYGKPALMANVKWKLNPTDDYDGDFTVQIQLESFTSADAIDKENWHHREVRVTDAMYTKDKQQFTLEWELLPIQSISIDALNNLLASGDEVLANSLLRSTDDVELGDDQIDYGTGDGIEY